MPQPRRARHQARKEYYGKQGCISCHMPETHRPWVPGSIAKKSRYHTFAGSGIPKVPNQGVHRLEGLSYTLELSDTMMTVRDTLQVMFKLKNEFAGHYVPSGDPERFILVDLLLISESNDTLVHEVERIGEVWEWYPVAKKISDNNMKPKEERIYSVQERLDKGEYMLEVKVSKHRLDEETAKYNKLGEDYPLFIEVYNKSKNIIVN